MKKERSFFNDKLIDSHTHYGMSLSCFFDDKVPACQNMLGLLEMLDNSQTSCAITFPFPNKFVGINVLENEENNNIIRQVFDPIPYKIQNSILLLDAKETAKEKIIPFLMCSLSYSIEEQIEYLRSEKNNFYGLKYYADTDNIPIMDFLSKGRAFLEFLLENNMPITFHVSADTVVKGTGLSYPNDILKIAKEYPDLRICIAHMAQFSKSVFNELQHEQYKNVYIDTSPFLHLCNVKKLVPSSNCIDFDYSNPSNVLHDCIEMLPNNIIWGTDYPFNFTCNLNNKYHCKDYEDFSSSKYNKLFSTLSEENKKRIANKNTLDFVFGKE